MRTRPARTATSDHNEYVESHPAYGMVGVVQTSSSPGTFLAGSDFAHSHFITLRIHEADMSRGMSRDWWHANRMVAEVHLSEAQWSALVARPGYGDGTPCTISFAAGDAARRPGIQPIEDRREQYRGEVDKHLLDALAALDEVVTAAPTKALRQKAERARGLLAAGLPWVAQQFDEHAEATIVKAKMEVESYVSQAVTRAGLKALAGDAPFLLGDATDDA